MSLVAPTKNLKFQIILTFSNFHHKTRTFLTFLMEIRKKEKKYDNFTSQIFCAMGF